MRHDKQLGCDLDTPSYFGSTANSISSSPEYFRATDSAKGASRYDVHIGDGGGGSWKGRCSIGDCVNLIV